MQKVDSCCCGCSLRTGTLILLILTLIGEILSVLKSFGAPGNQAGNIVFGLIVIGIAAAGIYGATQEKPVFLIPYMVILLLGLVALIIAMIATLIFGSAIIAYVAEHAADPESAKNIKAGGATVIIISEIFYGIFAVLSYYFYIVVLSYFKKLRSGSE